LIREVGGGKWGIKEPGNRLLFLYAVRGAGGSGFQPEKSLPERVPGSFYFVVALAEVRCSPEIPPQALLKLPAELRGSLFPSSSLWAVMKSATLR
jgi:hypothetical protein